MQRYNLFRKYIYLCSTKLNNGALAHLARAFDWQSRGGEFESRMLHNQERMLRCVASFSFYKNNRVSVLQSQQNSLPLSKDLDITFFFT